MSNANFNQALLHKTEFREATVNDTIFAALDLGGAYNLSTVIHEPQSTLSIGTDTLLITLRNSGGQFSAEQEAFFSKGGVAREVLNTLRHSAGSVGAA